MIQKILDDLAGKIALAVIERLIIPDDVVKMAKKQAGELREILTKSYQEFESRVSKIERGLGTLRCLACGSYACRSAVEDEHGLAMLHCSYCDAAYELKGPRYGAKFQQQGYDTWREKIGLK